MKHNFITWGISCVLIAMLLTGCNTSSEETVTVEATEQPEPEEMESEKVEAPVEDTVSEEDMEKLEEFLKNFENEITKMMTIINMIVNNSDSNNAVSVDVKSDKAELDDILADVLAKLN